MRALTVILLIALLSMTAPVRAAVNEVVGTGTAGSCTEDALRNAVKSLNNNNGGTITFNCGGAHTFPLTKQLKFDTANANYVIDGGGVITLDGQTDTRVIYTASGLHLSLTVRNLSIINGRAKNDAPGERAANQGGGIYSGYRNTLTVENVTFVNNRATAERHPYHGGGAIAIDTTSIVTITDSTFIDNRSPNGGAINNLLSVLTIERSLFQANMSTSPDPGGGGAIYNDAGKLTIKDSHIFDNSSANLGGGIFTWAHNVNGSYSGPTTIKNTVIDGNSAEHGGGLWKGGFYILKLKNSSVTNNTATDVGGGISGTGPGKDFKIVNTTFAYNSVTTTGSAGALFSTAGSTVTSATFAFNTVPNDDASVGGAIHAKATVKNTIFLGNTGGWNGIRGCFGAITNGGHNIQSPGDSCGGGIPIKDALLNAALEPARASLTFGQTQVLVPLPGSPAYNAGANCPGTDQRGVSRPQGDACDIGAYEKIGTAPGDVTITFPTDGGTAGTQPIITWTPSAGADTYKIIIKKSNGDKVYSTVRTPGASNCAATCSLNIAADDEITLKTGKAYSVKVKARSDFGSRADKATFTVTG
ncbi:MAG: hypothetical protein IPM16_16325 [Chloroflexi bacterium]|nr:hypothetical protein [Chloroflexota bacterium]